MLFSSRVFLRTYSESRKSQNLNPSNLSPPLSFLRLSVGPPLSSRRGPTLTCVASDGIGRVPMLTCVASDGVGRGLGPRVHRRHGAHLPRRHGNGPRPAHQSKTRPPPPHTRPSSCRRIGKSSWNCVACRIVQIKKACPQLCVPTSRSPLDTLYPLSSAAW
jgi:hypothetical protein